MDCRQALRVTSGALGLLTALALGQAQAAEPSPSEPAPRAQVEADAQLNEAKTLLDEGKSEEALKRLVLVQKRAEASGDTDLLASTLLLKATAHKRLGDPNAELQALQAANPLFCASPLPALRDQCAQSTLDIGVTMAWMGHPEAPAQLERAIQQARADTRPDLEISALNILGEALQRRDALTEAEMRHQEALDLATTLNDVPQQGDALVGLGRLALLRGALPEAEAHLQAALDLSTQHSAPFVQAMATLELGRLRFHQGRTIDTIVIYERAFELFRALKDLSGLADVMIAQGALVFELEPDYRSNTDDLYRRALELKTQLGDVYGQMWALIGLGTVGGARFEGDDPEQILEEARVLAVSIGSRAGEATALLGLAENQYRQLDRADAERNFQRAYEIYVELGIPKGQAEALLGLGFCQQHHQEYHEAFQSHEQAWEITHRHGLKAVEDNALWGLRQTLPSSAIQLRKEGKPVEAEAVWRRDIEIATQTGDLLREANAYGGLGSELAAQDRLPEAEVAMRRSVDLHTRRVVDPYTGRVVPNFFVALKHMELADVQLAQGELPEAELTLRQGIEHLGDSSFDFSHLMLLLKLADMRSQAGQLEEAEQAYRELVDVAAVHHWPQDEVAARLLLASWLMDQDRRAEAEELLSLCVKGARSEKREGEREDLKVMCLIELSKTQESPRAALRSARRAVAAVKTSDSMARKAAAYFALAEAYKRLGELEKAEGAMQQGVRYAEQVDDRWSMDSTAQWLSFVRRSEVESEAAPVVPRE